MILRINLLNVHNTTERVFFNKMCVIKNSLIKQDYRYELIQKSNKKI